MPSPVPSPVMSARGGPRLVGLTAAALSLLMARADASPVPAGFGAVGPAQSEKQQPCSKVAQ